MVFLDLGGDHPAALAAMHEAAKRLGVNSRFLGMAALDEHLLDFVPQSFLDDGRVPSLVYLPGVAEETDVEGIGKNELHVVLVHRVAVPALDAVIEEKLGNVLETRIALRVQLESGTDNFGLRAMDDDGLRPDVVHVSHGSGARKLAAPRFLVEAALGVRGKIEDELIGHAELHGHHKDVVVRIIVVVVGADMLDHSLLEHPAHLSTVHRIPRQPIQFPADDALRLAFLDAFYHLVEHGAAGHLGGAFLNEFFEDIQTIGLSDGAQFG